MADDVIWTHWRWGGRELSGRDRVMQRYFGPLVESFPDLDFRVFDAIIGEHTLVLRGLFKATFAKDWGEVPAHGRTVTWTAHDIYEFRNGKIVHAWYANDTLTVARQLGVISDEPRFIGHNPSEDSSR